MSARRNASISLAMACRDGHLDDVLYLIEKCHADIEQVDSLIFDGNRVVYGATPLWCAAAAGHLDIVKLLLKYKAAVNNNGETNSTPLQVVCFYGHFEIAKYLIQHGADIEVVNSHGDTCLIIASSNGHYEICKYLLECGASVNRKNVKGRTALHGYVESKSLNCKTVNSLKSLNIFKLLLENGAKIDSDSYDTDLLLSAAATGHPAIVQYFFHEFDCTEYDKINALELLGATLIDKNSCHRVMALNCWRHAMFLRYGDKEYPLEKPIVQSPIASYVNATEFRTFLQLEDLISQPDEMRIQALLVRERILGPDHFENIFYVGCRAAAYASNGNIGRSIRLFMYALDVQKEVHKQFSHMTQSILTSLAQLFSYMVSEAIDLPTVSFRKCILQVFERAVKEIESALDLSSQKLQQDFNETEQFHRTLIIVMHLIGLMCQLQLYLNQSEELQLKKSVYRLVQMKPKGQNGCTLLHLACSKDTSNLGRQHISAFPSSQVVDLLLEVGACPNALDLSHNTPLHIAAMNRPFARNVFKSLLNHGAHLDICNFKKQTPLQLVEYTYNIIDLYPLKHINLQCLCAKTVQSNGIAYKGYVYKRLEEFINAH